MVYDLMTRLINAAIKNGTIDAKRDGYVEKLNAFYMNSQITTDEYNALMALLYPAKDGE